MIYRMIVFRHRKCFGGTGYLSGHRKGFRAPPAKDMSLMGQEGKRSSQQGLPCPPYGPHLRGRKQGKREGRGGIRPPPSFPPPSSFLSPPEFMEGGEAELGRRPSRIPPTWGAPLAASPPLQSIYMRGAPLEHTSTVVSHVRCPPPQFTPPVIFT